MIDRLLDNPLSTKDHARLEKFYSNNTHTNYYELYDFINHYLTSYSGSIQISPPADFNSYIIKFSNEEIKVAILRNYLELFLEYLMYANYHDKKFLNSLVTATNLISNKASMDLPELISIYDSVMQEIDSYPKEISQIDVFKSKNFSKALMYGRILALWLNNKDKVMKVYIKGAI